jgi:hypothetical protein
VLNRFTSCANGLTPAAGFPVTVARMSGAVACPVSGLDRCNDGNVLSSPTVAPDPNNAAHVFVSFAENDGSSGERVMTLESTNGGVTFPRRITVSDSLSARRFMPWSCSTRGRAWVGWYDRSAATAAGANNDLTEYFLGRAWGTARNLSNNPDPQCASGWPFAPRNKNDSESCSVQPQLAGVCQRDGGGGSGNRCDFSIPFGCPRGETCQTGPGAPKYGDYNGIACAGNNVIAAWASATAPAGLPAVPGLSVYSETLSLGAERAEIWRFTGTACSGNDCPGWQMLDDNPKATSIVADGSQIYQLHDDGSVWSYIGTPCSGNACPGWQMLDNNPRAISIAAAFNWLYQLHDDGSIWRYTGTPCSSNVCPGWQMLDKNARATSIVATGNQLYQLHTNGSIWSYTGTPCSGSVCAGWQMLDKGGVNPRANSIAAGGYQLYHLKNNGSIWRYLGVPCTPLFCPGSQVIDNNPRATSIAADGNRLYQLHDNGSIWSYTGTPCSGNVCPGWQIIDNNPSATSIVASSNRLYQLHNDGSIWRYTGTPCSGNVCTGWQMLDNYPKAYATSIVASSNQLYQLRTNQ